MYRMRKLQLCMSFQKTGSTVGQDHEETCFSWEEKEKIKKEVDCCEWEISGFIFTTCACQGFHKQNHALCDYRIASCQSFWYLEFWFTGLIIEANPLMANIITNSIATFFIKVLLPAVLFIYLYIRLKTATVKMIKLTNYCLIGLLGFYLIINVLHLVWFLMLHFFV